MKVRDIIQNNAITKESNAGRTEAVQVSVLMPTFRRAKSGLFEQAVQSVCHQTLTNWELIIIDDASTDGTEQLIDAFMKQDPRISSIRHIQNIGLPAISEYEAYKMSHGKYIAFLFDDVVWEADALEKTVSFMEETHCVASYGVAKLMINSLGAYDTIGKPGQFSNEELIFTNAIANFAVVVHRAVIEDIGLYDPHLSLTRNCDWDLWTRIAKKYELVATGIEFGTEKGYILPDSLGNTHRLNLWVCAEHFRHARNHLLRPDVFETYDILETFEERSWLYVSEMKRILAQYRQKFWFPMVSYQPLVSSEYKHILLLVNDADASLLSFERLNNCRITLRYAKYIWRDFFPHDICMADAIIIHRNIYKWKEYISMFISAGIPLYYYIDDNFPVLAESGLEDAALLASCITKQGLAQFQGVFLSTHELKEYFQEHELHKNLYVLPPAMPILETECYIKQTENQNVHIAFFGGGFRYSSLKSSVLPALEKVAVEFPITLYLPEDAKVALGQSHHFPVHYIPRTKILDRAIHSYAQYNIDIQIHCGDSMPNNKYKTLNALCNSVMLGAALITSELPPFTNCKELIGTAYLTSKNTIDDWYENLLKLITDKRLRMNLLEHATQFCLHTYSPSVASQSLMDGMKDLEETNISTVLERNDKLWGYEYKLHHTNNMPSFFSKLFRLLRIVKDYWQQYSIKSIAIITNKIIRKIRGN